MAINMGSAVGYIELNTTKFRKGLLEAKTSFQGFTKETEDGASKFQVVGNKISAVGAGVSKVGGVLTKFVTVPMAIAGATAIKMSGEFKTAFAKVKTIADETVVPFGKLEDQVKSLSKQTGYSAIEVSDALYEVLSATGDTATAMDYVAQAAKLAKAGFTTVENAVDGSTTVLNAYGLKGAEAFQKVSDIMIITQNVGKTTVDELSGHLAQVIPTAAAMGVQFDIVGASLAALTAQGTPTAEATTKLNSLFAELGKQGTEASKNLAKATKGTQYAGKGFQQLIKEGVPLNQILELMKTYAEKNGSALLDMFGSIEAGSGALQLTGEGGKIFTKTMEQMANSAGTTEKAFKTMMDTPEARMNKLKAAFGGIALDLGERLLPVVENLAKGIKKLFDKFDGMSEKQKDILFTVAKILFVAGPILMVLGKVITGVGLLVKILPLLANPIGLIVLAVVAVITVFTILWVKCKAFREFWINLWDGIKNVVKNFADWFVGVVKRLIEFFTKDIPKAFTFVIKAIGGFFSTLFSSIGNFFASVFEKVGNFFAMVINAITTFFSNIPYYIGMALGYIAGMFVNLLIMIADFFTKTVPDIFMKFIDFVSKLPKIVFDFIVSIINAIINFISSIPKIVANFFISLGTTISRFAKDIWNRAMEIGSNIYHGVVDFVMAIPGAVAGWFASIPGKIREIGGALYDAGRSIITSLWDGMKSVWNSITDWFGNCWQDIKDFFGGFGDGYEKARKKSKKAVNGSHREGLSYVPFDGYISELHEGERVLTKQEAQRYNNNGKGGNTFIFQSPKAMDEYTARREFEKTIKKIDKDLL